MFITFSTNLAWLKQLNMKIKEFLKSCLKVLRDTKKTSFFKNK